MRWLAISAFIGMLSVVIGAFGAHIAAAKLSESVYKTLQVAIDYHQFYSLFLVVISLFNYQARDGFKFSKWVFNGALCGGCLFSGSLYLYVITGIKSFAMITPFGGILLIATWATVGIESYLYLKRKHQET
jgi:uncharacterized membrane protein YgdD (TMEM256/DUF423 family)